MNNPSLLQSQQQMQAIDIQEDAIKVSITSPYVAGTSETLRRTQGSHKIRFTF